MRNVMSPTATAFLMKTVLVWVLVFYRKSFHPFAWASHMASLAEETLHFVLVEECPIGTVLGVVPRGGGYRISALPVVADLFNYNATDGTIRTVGRVDREEHRDGTLLFTLVSVAEANGSSWTGPTIIGVRVDLLDLNDNPPVFSLNPQNISIPENSSIGGRFRLPSGPAIDPDLGVNGTVRKYTLLKNVSATSKKEFGLVVEGKDLFVEQLIELDRETRDAYALTLIAEDGGVPPMSGNSTIHISVVDINDNAPKFVFNDSSNFNASLNVHDLALPLLSSRNNAAAGPQLLTKLTAVDADEGPNGEVKYRLLQDPLAVPQKFAIDEHTGELFVLNATSWSASDREPFTTLQVEASDNGSPPLATRLYLRLRAREDRKSDDLKIGFTRASNATLVVDSSTTDGMLLEVIVLNGTDSTSGASLRLLAGDEDGALQWEAYGAYGLVRWNKNGTAGVKEQYVLAIEASDARGKRLTAANLTLVVRYPPGYIPISTTTAVSGKQLQNGFVDLFTLSPIDRSTGYANDTTKSLFELVSINTSSVEESDNHGDGSSADFHFFNWRRPLNTVAYASIGLISLLAVFILCVAALTSLERLKLYRKRKARRRLPRGFSHRLVMARLHAASSQANSMDTGTTTDVSGVDDGYYCTIGDSSRP